MTDHAITDQGGKRLKAVFNGAKSFFQSVFTWGTGETFHWTDWIFWGIYVAVISFGLWHHEPWSDEAYAWVMARDSDLPTLLWLLFHNYENHPGLQHLLLFPFTKLGFPYETQMVLNGLFAVAAVFVFLKKAVLPRLTKYLFIFSFYMAFEYALITRPYMLAIFFIFCVAAAYPHRFRYPLAYGLLVMLLFNADYICFALGVAILLAYGAECYWAHRTEKKILAAFFMMLLAAAWIFKQGILVSPDHYDSGVKSFNGVGSFFNAMRKALFPHGPEPYIFTWLEPWITPFCAVFFCISLAALFGNPAAFLGLFLTLAEFFYLFTFKRVGDLRHFGFLLVILVFGLWISRTGEAGQPLDRFWKGPPLFLKEMLRRISIGFLTLCLMIGTPFAFFAYFLEYKRVFSGAKEMGAIINAADRRLHLMDQGYVIVTWSPNTTGVAAYLSGKAMWNVCMEKPIGYYPAVKELRSCENLSYAQVFERVEKRFHDLSRVLLLTKNTLPFENAGGYHFFMVAQTNPRPFGYMYEKFFLYGIKRESADTGAV